MGLSSEIGSLEVGKKADLAIIDLDGLHVWPASGGSIYGRIVYQARSRDVCLTMVDGRIVYENGKLTTIDQTLLARMTAESIQRVKSRLPHLS